MALTYYIRSWDPRSTYPKNPQEGDICYTITLDQTWAPVGGVKKDNIVKEEIYQNGAWVEQGGGPEPSGTKIFEGEVTAVEGGGGMIGGTITPDLSGMGDEPPATLTVVLNGTEATLPVDLEHSGSGVYYGEYDGTFVFTTYPCALILGPQSALIVPEAGTYSLAIYA